MSNVSLAEIIKEYKLWEKRPSSSKLTEINAHNTNTTISSQHIFDIYKQIYDYWYDFLSNINLNSAKLEQRNKVESFLSMKKYKKQNMTAEKCYHFIHHEFDNLLKGICSPPIRSQNENVPPITTNGNIHSDFIHCMPFGPVPKAAYRLYINIKPENICELSKKLMQICCEQKIRLYFKFWTRDDRNDTFLIYTNHIYFKRMIDILKQIKQDNPKIFEGCENMNPLLKNIENFIGFGEEPQYTHSSFNLERGLAIDEFSNEVLSKKIVEERKRIGNYTGKIATEIGNLKIENFLIYLLGQSFRDKIIQNQKNITNKLYPAHFAQFGADAVSTYIKIENEIYKTCLNGVPTFIIQQIKEKAKEYLNKLINGRISDFINIEFPIHNLNTLTPDEKILLKKIFSYSSENYIISLNPKTIQEKLFSVFGSDKKIESLITDEALAPYLEKHHISSKHLELNIETEQLFKR